MRQIDPDTDDEPLVRPCNRNVAQRRSIEVVTATEDELMVPSSTVPASGARVRAARGGPRRAVPENVQQRE